MPATIKLRWMTRNGTPTGCPQCAGKAVYFTTTQPIDGWPSRGWCSACSHSWEDILITNAIVRQILTERTGRAKATDRDTFAVAAPGQYLEGELVPELVADDLRRAGKVLWKQALKPALRKKKNAAKRAAKKAVIDRPKKAVIGGAKKAVSGPAAALLTAAWTAQAGGFEDAEIANPCPADCNRGWFDLDTSLHEHARVRCSLCGGTGEYGG